MPSQMVEHAIGLLGGHICWQLRAVKTETTASGAADLPAILALSERRQSLLDRLEEYAVGSETNASEGVKQAVRRFRSSSSRKVCTA